MAAFGTALYVSFQLKQISRKGQGGRTCLGRKNGGKKNVGAISGRSRGPDFSRRCRLGRFELILSRPGKFQRSDYLGKHCKHIYACKCNGQRDQRL